MHQPIEHLSDDSRIWVFGISPALDETRSAILLDAIDGFLAGWAAHGTSIASARAVIEGSFLVIAVDRQSETSGCSIDKMFGLVQALEPRLGAAILDPNRLFYRDAAGAVAAASRADFRKLATSGAITPDTIVFDTLAERLGEVRSARWEKPVRESWHREIIN
ncbi:MAG TPA: hypothetical protein VEZ11_17395 [Thermoanaerobaculia bacterium]|nr:hypothetical protein [Thermoanaerobaculia bacterium]